MRKYIQRLLEIAITSLKNQGELDASVTANIIVDRARDAQHGDYATNLALIIAKQARTNPRELANKITRVIPEDDSITKIEVAGPGFINFFVAPQAQLDIVRQIHDQGDQFGESQLGKGQKVLIEFVSANPTGPLHVGHGRGAAYGAVVANLLTAVGFDVEKEYYINDAGRQMDILALSIWLRYLEECGEVLPFPYNGYRGEYVRHIAREFHKSADNRYRRPGELVMEDIPADESQGGDKEIHIDALIERAKTLLGPDQYGDFSQLGLDQMLREIREDLGEFGVRYDRWFCERRLLSEGTIEVCLNKLRDAGYLYDKEGAAWFASSRLGDEKDRVVIRENGQPTYFASDIAYHLNKLERGFDKIINIWGADHHGYVPRVRAAMQALGADVSKLEVLLVQFAVLFRGNEKIQMSTRSGDFVTLRQLLNEVGKDAARFFYVMRKSDQHMDFDLKLACSESADNPVYYVQYAHARICSVLRQLDERRLERDLKMGMEYLHLLTEDHESALINTLSRYPEIVERAAVYYEPHQLTHYLRELANQFHTYYNAHQFLVENAQLRNARLNLISAIMQVVGNGLELLDVSAPESM